MGGLKGEGTSGALGGSAAPTPASGSGDTPGVRTLSAAPGPGPTTNDDRVPSRRGPDASTDLCGADDARPAGGPEAEPPGGPRGGRADPGEVPDVRALSAQDEGLV